MNVPCAEIEAIRQCVSWPLCNAYGRKMAVMHTPAIAAVLATACWVVALASLRRHIVWVWFAGMPGLLAHELAHWIAAALTGARPGALSIIPRRTQDGGWVLGSVRLYHLTWVNGAAVGLAPLALLMGAWFLAAGAHLQHPLAFLARTYLAGCFLAYAAPSTQDLRLASRTLVAVAGISGVVLLILRWPHL